MASICIETAIFLGTLVVAVLLASAAPGVWAHVVLILCATAYGVIF